MIYKLNNNIKITNNFLNDFLKNRKIEDLQKFLNPSKDELYSFLLLDNIVTAAKCLMEHIKNNDNIFIQVDSDCDGYTSAAVMYLYIKRINPDIKIEWALHDGKQHGLNLDLIPDDTKLVIAPDSSSNDYELHKVLKEKGIDIIVLDHHISDEGYSKDAIVVNNQLSKNYPNKSLCGAGVVYKFCCCLDEVLNVNYANDFIDLVAVGMIGDMMELIDLETRFIINEGLHHIENIGLTSMIDKQSFSLGGKLTPTGIAFYIVPLINALIRVGSQEEKKVLFRSFIDPLVELPSTKRGHKPGDTETASAQAVRICTNAKNRQDRMKTKAFEMLDFKIQKLNLDEHKIIIVIVDEDEEFDNSLTGLVAMQLVSKYKKPVCVVRENPEGFLKGSARGVNNSPISDLRQFFINSNYFEYAMGHPNAHGISIPKANLEKFLQYADEKLKDVDFNENCYEVDLIIDALNPLLKEIILEFGQLGEIWGNGIEEPLIAVENINLTNSDISLIGQDKTTVKFVIDGITYIKFKDKDFIEKLLNNSRMKINLIGKAAINEWAGECKPQILIENYEIKNTSLEF